MTDKITALQQNKTDTLPSQSEARRGLEKLVDLRAGLCLARQVQARNIFFRHQDETRDFVGFMYYTATYIKRRGLRPAFSHSFKSSSLYGLAKRLAKAVPSGVVTPNGLTIPLIRKGKLVAQSVTAVRPSLRAAISSAL